MLETILTCAGYIAAGFLAGWMVWRRKGARRISEKIKPAVATVRFDAVSKPLEFKMPEPRGEKIQVMRTITKRTAGSRTLKMGWGKIFRDVKIPWMEMKTWNEWQAVELVSQNKRTVVVRYPDGREVTVKKTRTMPA